MSQYRLLNNVEHKHVKIITRKSETFGDNVAGALIFPEEFSDVQKEYPIFFQKNPDTGDFQAVAIFGFMENENLFLHENGWCANYIPAVITREPFFIGFQSNQSGDDELEAVVHIDMDSPRISQGDEGEPVFLEHGGNSSYLNKISQALMLMHEGLAIANNMFAALLEMDLIEPFMLKIEFNSGELYQSDAFYTINQEKFFALDDLSLGKLHRSGDLYYLHMAIASLKNIQRLIDLHNQRLKIQGR